MLSVALLWQLWKVGRMWWPLGWFLKLLHILQLLFGSTVACLKKYRKQYSHQAEPCNHRQCMVDYAFDNLWNLCSWLDAVSVFVKVITKSCSEGVVLALSVASSTSSKWWSCWDKTLVCRKCLTLAGAGWLSPRYPATAHWSPTRRPTTNTCNYLHHFLSLAFTFRESLPFLLASFLVDRFFPGISGGIIATTKMKYENCISSKCYSAIGELQGQHFNILRTVARTICLYLEW